MILNWNYFKVNCNEACITTAVDLNTQITMTFKKKKKKKSSPEDTKYKQKVQDIVFLIF